MTDHTPSGQQAVEPWQIVRASMVEQAGDDNPSRVARNILHALRNAGFTVSRTAAPTAPSTVVGEPALVCGCGWEGSYADLNETAEGMTCPKCRLSRNMVCATTPPAQGVEEENETLENLIDAAIGARTAPPWEEQAAQIRRQALEEAAKVCDQRAKTAVSHMGATDVPSHKEAFARDAEEAEDCADDIRALLSKPAKGEG